MLTDTMSWREGQNACETLGGYLAEIKTEEQQTFLVSPVRSEKKKLLMIFYKRKVWRCLKRKYWARSPGLLVSLIRVMRGGKTEGRRHGIKTRQSPFQLKGSYELIYII